MQRWDPGKYLDFPHFRFYGKIFLEIEEGSNRDQTYENKYVILKSYSTTFAETMQNGILLKNELGESPVIQAQIF